MRPLVEGRNGSAGKPGPDRALVRKCPADGAVGKTREFILAFLIHDNPSVLGMLSRTRREDPGRNRKLVREPQRIRRASRNVSALAVERESGSDAAGTV